ncbi:MAG: FAD-dependent monooxygenase [Terracidiphilus sp.]
MSAAIRASGHLVIGGGLAGSMAAMRLAAAGREVTLLEKELSAHHKVCGEFLSREAVMYLRSAGVEPLDLGAAAIRVVRLSSKRALVEAALPFTALSLSRRVLDEAMLARAERTGCRVERGAFVEGISREGSLWCAKLRSGQSWHAENIFLASGKHDLGGWEREGGAQGDLVGFKLHWRLAPAQTSALRGAMELFLFTGGYGGVSLVEDDVATLCLVVRRAELRKLGGWSGLFANLMHENRHVSLRLQGATALWERPLAIFPIPYGYVARRGNNLWRVGDQAAVIPSFTGDGMSIALHSGALAAEMYLAGKCADEYQHELSAHLWRSMALSTRLSQVMVSRIGRTVAPFALAAIPNAMGWIANFTRIPQNALAARQAN